MKYIYKYEYNSEILEMGLTLDLNKLYKKNFPNPNYYNKGEFYEKLVEKDIYYRQATIYFIAFDEDSEATTALSEIEQGSNKYDEQWQKYEPKTQNIDDDMYGNKLLNRIEFLTDDIKKSIDLHKFLLENFNTEDDVIYYVQTITRSQNWKNLNDFEKNKIIKQYVNINKKVELARGYNIKIFSDYEIDEMSDLQNIIIRLKIYTAKIPFLAAAIYNSLIFAAHEYNLLAKFKKENLYMVYSADMPFYQQVKPIKEKYTKELYEQYKAQKAQPANS